MYEYTRTLEQYEYMNIEVLFTTIYEYLIAKRGERVVTPNPKKVCKTFLNIFDVVMERRAVRDGLHCVTREQRAYERVQ